MNYLNSILISQQKASICLHSPAKVNLYLRVLDKRPDGYHNLENLMQAISFYDEVEIRLLPHSDGKKVILECENGDVPHSDENIAVKAAMKFIAASGMKTGVNIGLKKNIPMGAGLGGGSSNAGTVLLGLNALTGNPLPMSKLVETAIELGSDVPFFLYGGMALCKGKGEIVESLKELPELWIVLVNPGFPISTKRTYEIFEKNRLTRNSKSAILLNCNCLQQVSGLLIAMYNDLEEAAILQYPLLKDIKELLVKGGCKKAMVTGSGSTVYGICNSRETSERVSYSLRTRLDEGCVITTASNRLKEV